MNNLQIAAFKDRILENLSNEILLTQLVSILNSDVETVTTLCNEMEKDGLINSLDIGSKTGRDKYILITEEGKFFLKSKSYKRKYWLKIGSYILVALPLIYGAIEIALSILQINN